ncbi:putative polyhydroxyalkanoic acid system protein [Pseudobythopirellula maris]|uniref:Putative polyhydroxyalkanoic acid system protein n=1 Tax=Pseudobythopirellula maris TaxID=2527991 RepID=A0A5C5ZT99_9BACT|nr:polyhydroxyalkanoic acid system family protein [Pseudobythopirellula maris]TWT90470.1 putative polyhydroxyalkanoic acid system protein [Pseudobythopirellula maris]
MPKIDLDIPHPLSAEGAKERLMGFSQQLTEKHGGQITDVEQTWRDNELDFGFKVMGMYRVAGTLTVEENKLHVKGDLPITAAMFKGAIESAIRDQLGSLMSA